MNVLLGDMSLIGPKSFREEDASHHEQVLSGYSRRYAVKPGIYSLSPCSQEVLSEGNIQKMKARTRLDLFYINHWSVSLDFKLMLRALRKMAGISLNYSQNDLRDFS
jgi:lipopolysaccharide/colanic/teichoic acid biosynthesis glycosyltransferase